MAVVRDFFPLLPGAQPFVPSLTVGDWADPNSVLASVSASAGVLSLTMQNPAAARDLPSTGASYVIPIVNLYGRSITLDNASVRHLLMAFTAGTSVPADCWVGMSWINTATVAAATVGIGITIQGNGTGLRASRNHYNAGWAVAGATTYTATVRYGVHDMNPSSAGTTQSKGVTAGCYDSAGAFISAASGGDTTSTYNTAPVAYVALSCGWVAGSGSGGEVITVSPFVISSLPSGFPGVV